MELAKSPETARLGRLIGVQSVALVITLIAVGASDPPQAFVSVLWALVFVEIFLIGFTARALLETSRARVFDGEHDAAELPSELRPECRVLLIGLGRSGKTSIIRQVLTGTSRREASTQHFAIYRAPRVHDLGGAPFDLVLADYQGQKFSQLVLDPPQRFFGPRGARAINALLFVVDLFREFRGADGEPVNDSVLLEHYARDTDAQIRERVDEQCKYINEYTLEIILQTTFNRREICAVFLVVNKIDLLRALVERGCVPGVTSMGIQRYVSDLYAPLVELVKEAARANEVEPLFGAYLISARTGENVATVFSEVITRYQASRVRGEAGRAPQQGALYG